MNLKVKALDLQNKEILIESFENKKLFFQKTQEAFALREQENKLSNADYVMRIFTNGATIAKKDFGILKRALRHYDEVYLCNELCDILEEYNINAISVAGKITNPTDISAYQI